MILPKDKGRLATYIRWVIDTCFDSQKDRTSMYERRRKYYLFGTQAHEEILYNRMTSHLDLVSSFLYSGDRAQYDIAAPRNSNPVVVAQTRALQDAWNDDFRDTGLSDLFGVALDWALALDCILIKSGWSNMKDQNFGKIIHPQDFGVFREDEPDLDSQEAFTHTFVIGYDEAVQRLTRAGRKEDIDRLETVNTPFVSPFPNLITRLIVTATGGTDLTGNIMGQAPPSPLLLPDYHPKVNQPLVRFNEVYVWDDEHADYRIFEVIEPDMIVSDSAKVVEAKKLGNVKAFGENKKYLEQFLDSTSNDFLPKEHPFTLVRPHAMPEYFWGRAHIDGLIKLQDWSNERLDQIHDLLDRQANPSKVFSGFMGLTDEKMDAMGGADTWVYDQLPNAKVEYLTPDMPEDLFADFNQIGQIFLEASGLTEVVAGRGEAGVRSRGHARELKTSGSGRIKKLAVGLEAPLVRLGDLGVKLKMKNDDDVLTADTGEKFYPAQVDPKYTMRIAGHSHSPLFSDESKEMAALLFKAQAIDQEMLIRLLNPPARDNMIAALRERVRQQQLAALSRPPAPGRGASGKARGEGNAAA